MSWLRDYLLNNPVPKMASNHSTSLLRIELIEQLCRLLFTSVAFIQVQFRPDFIRDVNTINPDQTAPSWEQSDLGS